MASPAPLLEFQYIDAAESLEAQLGLSVRDLQELALDCDSGSAYESDVLQVRGKWRRVDVPNDRLDRVQQAIAKMLYPIDTALDESAHGYVAGRSTRTNALAHVGAAHLQKFDIASFFGSITSSQVASALQGAGFGRPAASLLSRLVTCEGVVPLGSRTSPRVSNVVLDGFDRDMVEVARVRGLAYSRYADDLTFSGPEVVDVTSQVSSALALLGLRLNEGKTKRFRQGQPMYVTGLSVADASGPRVRKRLKRSLRQQLHYIERFGFDDHASHSGANHRWLSGRLAGQLHYLRSIEPETAARLATQFPTAYAALVPTRPDTRAERGQRIRLELLEEIARADSQSLPPYRPFVPMF